MTYRELFALGEKALISADIVDARNDAWLLLAMVCKIDRTFYFVHMDEEVDSGHGEEYQSVIRKRAEHVPLQYITGEQEFMGMTFRVNPNVLIPRQDTETLVEEALLRSHPGMRVLDMCTGSGCVLLSILKNCSAATGMGVDISKQALIVAKENAKENHIAAEFERSDLFEDVTGEFDMIVSNPPYIPSAVILDLMPEVRQYEPMIALDGKEDGLYFYRRIVAEDSSHLKQEGFLLFEIGWDQADAVKKIMLDAGYCQVTAIRDLAGNHRVVCGQKG